MSAVSSLAGEGGARYDEGAPLGARRSQRGVRHHRLGEAVHVVEVVVAAGRLPRRRAYRVVVQLALKVEGPFIQVELQIHLATPKRRLA